MVIGHLGHDAAERREDARVRGDDHAGHTELLRQPPRVERPGAAVGDQREAPEVVTALNGNQADRAPHGGVRHLEDAGGRGLPQLEPERLGDRRERGLRARRVHADRFAEERVADGASPPRRGRR